MKSKNDFLAISGIIILLTLVFVSCSTSKKSAVPCPVFTKYKSDYTIADHKRYRKNPISHINPQLKNRHIAFLKKNQANSPAVIKNTSSVDTVQSTEYLFHFNKADFQLLASADNSIMPLSRFSGDDTMQKYDHAEKQKDSSASLPVVCDTIILKSGVALIGKVEEIKQKEITYRKCNNLTGPLISILKSDVTRIDYSNGTHEVLSDNAIDNDNLYSHDKDVFVKEDSPIVKTEGLGVAGFVSSVVGLFVAGVILGMVGIIFGSISLRNIKRNPGRLKGRGLAIAAIILGVIAVIGALIVISAM